jgi:response regulator RpfG family c-di-GMP phosphodiesterase
MQVPVINTKVKWREAIANLTRIKTADTDMERKGQLLALFFALMGVVVTYIFINDLVYFSRFPSAEYAAYLAQELFGVLIFYGLWQINQRGNVYLAAYLSISSCILLTAFLSPPDYLEYVMVVFAVPIGISSFIIRPASSFVFAFLAAAAYVITSIWWQYAWQYNLTAIVSLFALAFMTWVISWRLENALKENAELIANLKKSNVQIRDAYETTLEGWSLALDLRDEETEGHTQRVTDLTVRLARAMHLSEEELVHVRRGALLHDIGKLGVPDAILLKPGKLDAEEWLVMKQHPRYAYGLLYPIQYLRDSLDIPCHHHEKWDDSGYPQGLAGVQIPLAARIFAVVDVYDALLYDRPYRKAWGKEMVLDYIKEQTGKHFDPQIVEIFLKEVAK